ncbi:hypothetical protein [Nocardia asiatica]|uniref:hypothetical protein n=1 Tax=Nocardia asiatica TaxID=209252 RepID=UPI00245892A2|nr:hypothetical protein [Nocardia asiatica]
MPLVTVDDVARGWLDLDTDQRADAELLIAAAEQWIRHPDRRPDVPEDDPIAKRVVLEVVRTALAPPAEFTGHTSYSDTMGPWAQSGTLATPAGTLVFTEAHAQLLGITSTAGPSWHFGDQPRGAV